MIEVAFHAFPRQLYFKKAARCPAIDSNLETLIAKSDLMPKSEFQ